MTLITVKCDWCSKILGTKESQGIQGEELGICNHCLDRNFPHHADLIRAILEIENIEEIFLTGNRKNKEGGNHERSI